MKTIQLTDADLERYVTWLHRRNYVYESVARRVRLARRLMNTFPDGIPLDLPRVIPVVESWVPSKSGRGNNRNDARALLEFCEKTLLEGRA